MSELRPNPEELARADRLVQIGTLAASVAHEINNPAAFVLTNLGLMAEQLAELGELLRQPDVDRTTAAHLVQEMMEMCDDNRTGVHRIARISRELRNYARVDHDTRRGVALNDVVTTALTMVGNQVRHHAELIADLSEVPGVIGDASKLAQVVMNLIVNSAHAIQEAGGRSGRIEVSTRARDGEVLIIVRDDGCGIPESVQERIFEPFFTTKASGEGTGLGLAVCADIVRDHGGRIECRSMPGRGTTFSVVLPNGRSIPPGKPVEPASPLSSRSARILVVDDDPHVLRSVRRALAPPHRVVTALGGKVAAELLGRDRQFDVIVCDVMMPSLDGAGLYEHAIAIEPELARRFIFMTGGVFSPEARNLVATIGTALCEKPLALSDLRTRIDNHLESMRSLEATIEPDDAKRCSDAAHPPSHDNRVANTADGGADAQRPSCHDARHSAA